MKKYIEWFVGLPFEEATLLEEAEASVNSKSIHALALGFLTATLAIFLLTFSISAHTYTPETNSLNFHPSFIWLLGFCGISAVLYYGFNQKKHVFWLLPGIIIGSGIFLAIVSFSLEIIFSGIITHVNFVVLATLIVAYLLDYFKVLQKNPWLERGLISLGSLLIYMAWGYISHTAHMSIYLNAPAELRDPLGGSKTLVACVLAIFLTTFLAVSHLKEINQRSEQSLPAKEKIHLAMTSFFIVFSLYICFLLVLGTFKKK